jgi:hypothetical protein
MNIYELEFFSICPTNGVRIKYEWKIETDGVLMVENLLKSAENTNNMFHEKIADEFYKRFGGIQTISAFHHGVTIRTLRK